MRILNIKDHMKQHAIAYTMGEEIYGAKATVNVWEPYVQAASEFSLSQIWVLSGSFDDSDLNSIEAGWQVHAMHASCMIYYIVADHICEFTLH